LNIETKSFTDLNYIVYNPIGQVQLQGKITASIQQLEVLSLQSGVYFIRFTDGRSSVVQRFIKQ
jgi:Secretion system C-terminal sorting domain